MLTKNSFQTTTLVYNNNNSNNNLMIIIIIIHRFKKIDYLQIQEYEY